MAEEEEWKVPFAQFSITSQDTAPSTRLLSSVHFVPKDSHSQGCKASLGSFSLLVSYVLNFMVGKL